MNITVGDGCDGGDGLRFKPFLTGLGNRWLLTGRLREMFLISYRGLRSFIAFITAITHWGFNVTGFFRQLPSSSQRCPLDDALGITIGFAPQPDVRQQRALNAIGIRRITIWRQRKIQRIPQQCNQLRLEVVLPVRLEVLAVLGPLPIVRKQPTSTRISVEFADAGIRDARIPNQVLVSPLSQVIGLQQ